jgi:hypothetical protein
VRQLRNAFPASTYSKIDMQKPTARGPTPSRKAHLILREKLNRKSKLPPPLPTVKNPAANLRSATGNRSAYGSQ